MNSKTVMLAAAIGSLFALSAPSLVAADDSLAVRAERQVIDGLPGPRQCE